MSRLLPYKVLAGAGAVAVVAAGGAQIASAAKTTSSSKSAGAGTTEVVLAGAQKSSVEPAVLAALPGATVKRASTETDGKSTDAFEAHVVKADGTRVEVLLDSGYGVTAINADKGHGGHGHGHGHGHGGGTATARPR